MENALFDQSPRSTLDVSISRSSMKSMGSYSSYSSSSSSSSYSPYSSTSSISHLLHNYNILPPSMAKINSVPNLYPNPTIIRSSPLYLPQPKQIPLLPLPLFKNSSFPSPCNNKTISNPSTPRRKPRAPKREPKVQTNKKKPLEKTLSSFSTSATTATKLVNTLDNLKDEVVIVSHAKNKDRFDRYSLSPHPSSLPLPGLKLLRHKTKVSDTSNIEAIIYKEARSNNCPVDNGATDDLRRILRL